MINTEFENIENIEEYTHIVVEEDQLNWIFKKEEFLENKEELLKDANAVYLAKKIK